MSDLPGPTPTMITHWRGHKVAMARSVGGVMAFPDPWDGMIRGNVKPWPPPELTQKLYKSRQARAFVDDQASLTTSLLGYYSDLQSVHSEDAVTWSLFGPMAYASADVRRHFVHQLLMSLGITEEIASASIWLWRRLPHPDNLVPGGPEVDVGIQTESTLILGEAKWRSSIGRGQGIDGEKDQIALRSLFCTNYGKRIYPEIRRFIILSIGRNKGGLTPEQLALSSGCVSVKQVSWQDLGELDTNPFAAEFRAQLAWRSKHSQV